MQMLHILLMEELFYVYCYECNDKKVDLLKIKKQK